MFNHSLYHCNIKFLCVRQQRISKDIHIEIFLSCKTEVRFTQSFGPSSELTASMAITSANVKRHSTHNVYIAFNHVRVDCGFMLSIQERQGQYRALQIFEVEKFSNMQNSNV